MFKYRNLSVNIDARIIPCFTKFYNFHRLHDPLVVNPTFMYHSILVNISTELDGMMGIA